MLVSVAYALALAFHHLVISVNDLAVSDCGLSLLQVCVSTTGKQVLFGKNLGMKDCGTGSALGYRQKT